MFRKMTLALLAGASCLAAGIHPAAAIEATAQGPQDPQVLYANPAVQPAAPVRTWCRLSQQRHPRQLIFRFHGSDHARGAGSRCRAAGDLTSPVGITEVESLSRRGRAP